MSQEVAVFIDLENLRYGMLNNHGQEPDFKSIVAKASQYGRPSVMRAYADFTEHPTNTTRELEIVGITAINVAVKRTPVTKGGTTVERIKNAADMVLALDAIVEAIDADSRQQVKVFLLVSGDRDYVKLVTLLKNRFGQRVIVLGVPGSIARDLIDAAGESELIDVPVKVPTAPTVIKKEIVKMVKAGPSPLKFWSSTIIHQWAKDRAPGTAKEKADAIAALFREGVLLQREIFDPRNGKETKKVNETYLDEQKSKECGYL